MHLCIYLSLRLNWLNINVTADLTHAIENAKFDSEIDVTRRIWMYFVALPLPLVISIPLY